MHDNFGVKTPLRRLRRPGYAPTAHQVRIRRRQIDISLRRLRRRIWKRHPGRPGSKWLHQIRPGNNFPPRLIYGDALSVVVILG